MDGHPEMNSCFTTIEGIPNNLNLATYGKCVITYKTTNNGYESVVESEKLGKLEISDEITQDGINSVTIFFLVCSQ